MDIVRFYRVRDWLHILGLSLLGFVYAPSSGRTIVGLGYCVVVSSLYLAFGYSSNTVFEDDAARRGGRRRVLLSFLPVFFLIPLAYMASAEVLWIMLAGVLLSISYSAPPLRLRNKPYLELVVNSCLFAILFLVGAAMPPGGITWGVLVFSAFIIVQVAPFQLIQELKDMDYDRGKGFKTTVLHAGVPGARYLIVCSAVMSALLAVISARVSGMSGMFPAAASVFCAYTAYAALSLRTGDRGQHVRLWRKMRLSSVAYGVAILASIMS